MEPLKSILVSSVKTKFERCFGQLYCEYRNSISHTSEVYFKKAKINHNAMYDKCTSQLHHFFPVCFDDEGANVSTSPG